VVLAGVGFLSLRQDRLLAQHEATEQARKIAANVALSLLPEAFQSQYVPAAAFERFRAVHSRPEDDPVWGRARQPGGSIGFLVDAQGGLLYPAAIGSWPAPRTLEADQLSPDQQRLWETAQRAVLDNLDPAQATLSFERFLTNSPPASFAAAAQYHLGRLRQNLGDAPAARHWFETMIEQYPNEPSETGYPWRLFAELKLLQLATAAPTVNERQVALVGSLCADAILNPSPLSPFLLDKMTSLDPRLNIAVREWRQVWIAHNRARNFHAYWQDALTDKAGVFSETKQPLWLKFNDGREWLAFPQSTPGNRWILGMTEDAVASLARQIAATPLVPAYLGVEIEIAGKALVKSTEGAVVLATAPSRANANASLPGLQVNVVLRDPAALFARQRTRSLLFGSLIALATGAVFLGFITARRAFLRQQHLSEMKSNFVSSVSHELRSPIASVRLMAEELEDSGSEDVPKNQRYHHFIVQECRRLSALIENVLDFSRHEQGRQQYEFEPTDLVALVQETTRLMRTYAADHQIAIATDIRGEPVPVEVDGRAIQQILVNLLDNAIKHSPKGSTVTLGLEFPAPEPGAHSFSTAEPVSIEIASPAVSAAPRSGAMNHHPALVLFWVEDHGAGIPPEEHELIFERFYRRGSELRRETQGVGLGLAIVKYATEAHGGKVTVRSAVGQGSRFTVELPICRES
jgi:signal transduction histidine kinase